MSTDGFLVVALIFICVGVIRIFERRKEDYIVNTSDVRDYVSIVIGVFMIILVIIF